MGQLIGKLSGKLSGRLTGQLTGQMRNKQAEVHADPPKRRFSTRFSSESQRDPGGGAATDTGAQQQTSTRFP
jgi:hypothetical protein